MQNFEGPEKKFELLVKDSVPSLRDRDYSFWAEIVSSCNASILSSKSDDLCTAYLLSESSLFVYDNRVVMITCGQTTLISALVTLLDTIPVGEIRSLMFERKNENFPEEQPTTFEDDIKIIQPRIPGESLVFGEKGKNYIALFHSTAYCEPEKNDVTLEILMHDISLESREAFQEGCEIKDSQPRERLLKFLNCPTIDEYFFSPAGYSLNALKDGSYSTVHVTPQKVGSFVSFETNLSFTNMPPNQAISHLLDIFAPEQADILCFGSPGNELVVPEEYKILHEEKKALSSGYRANFLSISST